MLSLFPCALVALAVSASPTCPEVPGDQAETLVEHAEALVSLSKALSKTAEACHKKIDPNCLATRKVCEAKRRAAEASAVAESPFRQALSAEYAGAGFPHEPIADLSAGKIDCQANRDTLLQFSSAQEALAEQKQSLAKQYQGLRAFVASKKEDCEETLAAEARRRVDQRETAKQEALAQREALVDQEKSAAAAAHAARLKAIEDNSALSAEQKRSAVDLERAKFNVEIEHTEKTARQKAEDAVEVDRSDERQRGQAGAVGWLGVGGIAGKGSAVLLGLSLQARHAFWRTAPDRGMASGLDLQIGADVFSPISGSAFTQTVGGFGAASYWLGRLGLGVAFDFHRRVSSENVQGSTVASSQLSAGLQLGFAAFDRREARCLIRAQYLPLLSWDPGRLQAELELGLGPIDLRAAAGTALHRQAGVAHRTWFASAGIGGRFRW